MANPEHVAKLKEGVTAWNLWRKENPYIGPRLDGADLRGEDLKGANLWAVDLKGANLTGVDLTGADLTGVSLITANLKDTCLMDVKFSSRHIGFYKRGKDTNLMHVEYSFRRLGHYKGMRLDGCYGSERFKRFTSHQAFIEELQKSGWRGKILYWIWFILADCGRTPWAWMAWSIFFTLSFAGAYTWMGSGAFTFSNELHLPFNFLTMLYYSIVTFTTLGFGDIAPVSGAAAAFVTTEVVVGYVMLGGLISFLFSKLLPR